MINRKLPDMHTFFRNGIFRRPQQKHVLKGHFASQQSLGQGPDFALASGTRRRARKSRNQRLDHISNFRTRDLSPRSCNGCGESSSTVQMSQACMGDDRPIVQIGSGQMILQIVQHSTNIMYADRAVSPSLKVAVASKLPMML